MQNCIVLSGNETVQLHCVMCTNLQPTCRCTKHTTLHQVSAEVMLKPPSSEEQSKATPRLHLQGDHLQHFNIFNTQ